MKRFVITSFVAVAVLSMASACRSGADLSRAETQSDFGVRMARMNLWREAMFRFQRAVELEPQNAMAHNNLAVAYEAIGDFDAAAAAYREALRLDRSNQHIQRNYSRYVEFTQRSKRREERPATSAARARAESAGATEGVPQPTGTDAEPDEAPTASSTEDEAEAQPEPVSAPEPPPTEPRPETSPDPDPIPDPPPPDAPMPAPGGAL